MPETISQSEALRHLLAGEDPLDSEACLDLPREGDAFEQIRHCTPMTEPAHLRACAEQHLQTLQEGGTIVPNTVSILWMLDLIGYLNRQEATAS